MPRPPAAQKKAGEFLNNFIGAGANTGPLSVTQMAARAGVSYLTMWKAVRRLKQEGRLHGNYRISIDNKQADRARPAPLPSPRIRLEQRLTGDLLTGVIVRGGDLLSAKELTARYATSFQTLRRVLHIVEGQGLIVPRGRHWSIHAPAASRPLSIVLIAYNQYSGDFLLPPLEREFLRSCEMTFVNARVTLTVVALRRREGSLRMTDMQGTDLSALPAGEQVAGYIYMLQSAEAFDGSIMKLLIAARKPVAVVDEAGIFPSEEKARDMRRVRLFVPSAHQRPARDVAAYLLSKGHRHAAYVSPFHADAWSQVRYAGLRSVFDKTGNGSSLSLFAENGSIKEDVPYVRSGEKLSNGKRLARLTERWHAGVPVDFSGGSNKVKQELSDFFLFHGVGAAVWRLLDAAIREPRITAWIIANDEAAYAALRYCRNKRIAVPARIAVIGFDDLIESSEMRLTSYNFNFPAASAAVVHFVLHPESIYWQRRRIVEIEGKLVERETG